MSNPTQKARPLVSVVTPARNAERYIGSCIDGVRNQTWTNVQHVIVDDGSTDRTRAILDAHGDQVKVVPSTGVGCGAARNKAAAAADGEYIALCDADDVLLPRHIETAMDMLASAPERSFVTADAYVLSDGGIDPSHRVLQWGVVPPEKQRLAILEANFVSIFTVMPRAMWEQTGGWTEGRTLEDWPMWMEAIYQGWNVLTQPHPSALYRWTPNSLMSDTDAIHRAEDAMFAEFMERHGAQLRPEERAYMELRERSGNPRAMGHRADDALRAGDIRGAAEAYTQASALLPHDRRTRAKSLSMRYVPATGRYWRKRLLDADQRTGRDQNKR